MIKLLNRSVQHRRVINTATEMKVNNLFLNLIRNLFLILCSCTIDRCLSIVSCQCLSRSLWFLLFRNQNSELAYKFERFQFILFNLSNGCRPVCVEEGYGMASEIPLIKSEQKNHCFLINLKKHTQFQCLSNRGLLWIIFIDYIQSRTCMWSILNEYYSCSNLIHWNWIQFYRNVLFKSKNLISDL